jgi:plasmid rolling circle replication initiator protein Rep
MSVAQVESYLSSISPTDVKFDVHKAAADKIAGLYALDGTDGFKGFMSGTRLVNFGTYSTKIYSCGSWLNFVQLTSGKVKLTDARFCHVPNCPMCQWRRTLVWRAKFLAVRPKIAEAYPSHRWIFLTLTLKNCKISELRSTIQHMSKSYKRMRQLADYPLTGYVRSLEVTRIWDWYDADHNFLGRHGVKWWYQHKDADKHLWTVEPTDEVHPHYHVLALVPASYFTGRSYVKHERWAEMWGKSLRVDYTPIVHIQTIKPKRGKKIDITPEQLENDDSGLIQGICETMKYTVKEQDLLGTFCKDDELNSDWLKQLTEQLYLIRRTEYSGILKEFGKELKEEESDNENLIKAGVQDDGTEEVERQLVFRWRSSLEKYILSSER